MATSSFPGPIVRARTARAVVLGPACAAALLLLATTPVTGRAQRIAGAGDDAIALPRGTWRLRIGGRWDVASERLDDVSADGRVPLGRRFGTDSLGVAAFPALAQAERAARRLTGLDGLQLSLGRLDAQLTERTSRLPFALDVGLTRRLALGVVVPYVETRALPRFALNPDGTTGAFGPNPTRDNTLAGVATANTRALLAALDGAAGALAERLQRCSAAPASDPACALVLGERAAVDALLAQSASARADLRALYGEAAGQGAAVVPIAGTPLDRLIAARLRGMGKLYERYGVATPLDGLGPSGARTRFGFDGLPAILRDTAFGVVADSLRPTRRYGVGDVDVTLSWLLVDRIGRGNRDPLARFGTTRRLAVRSLLVGGWRFGSAPADRADDLLDVPVDAGAPALLLRSTTDVLLSSRAWASLTGRLVLPRADQIVARVPATDADVFPVATSRAALERTLGRTVEVEVVPRWALTRTLGTSLAWAWRHRTADAYRVAPGDSPAPAGGRDPATLATGTAQSEQRLVFGVSYSTLEPFAARRSRHALELVYEHAEVLWGSGRFTRFATDRVEVRWYPGYPRRR